MRYEPGCGGCWPVSGARRPWAAVVLGVVSCLIAGGGLAEESQEGRPERWWKGNIHTHSLWSDGNDFPEMIADWYREHGYHFLALSDHNVLSEGMRWMRVTEIEKRGAQDALRKYEQRFPGGWVETRGERDTPSLEVRLKPLSEFRALFEERDRFLMIPGEEISDRAEGVPVHMNATNLKDVIQPLGGATVREAMSNNLRAVQEQARQQGREILMHLNHPNFGMAITAEDLAAVVQEQFFEVYNGHPDVGHLGDHYHPPVEQLWDIANALRLGQADGPILYGVATDDSHSYHGSSGSRPGRGWIMVRAVYLTPEHLIRAIQRGDFYASSGVLLQEVAFDAEAGKLSIRIEPRGDATFTTQFVGTRRGADLTSQPRLDAEGREMRATRVYSGEIGVVLATVEGDAPSYQLQGDELYVRAVVTSSRQHPDPSFDHQREQAWTQPVGWQRN